MDHMDDNANQNGEAPLDNDRSTVPKKMKNGNASLTTASGDDTRSHQVKFFIEEWI